jgi:hypothetical protein
MDEEMHKNDGRDQQEREESSTVFGTNSAVKVGSLGIIGAVIWWAAVLTADVSTIKSSLVRLNSLDSLGSRMDSIEKYGSTPLRELQKEVSQLAEALRMHLAKADSQKQ